MNGFFGLILVGALLGTSSFTNIPSISDGPTATIGTPETVSDYEENSPYTSVILELDMENPTSEDLENAAMIIEQRVNASGYDLNEIEVSNDNRISVKIYKVEENDEVINDEVINDIVSQLIESPELKFMDYDGNVYLTSDDIVKAEVVRYSEPVTGLIENQVMLTFTEEGTNKFYEATEATIGSQLIITLGDEVISMPSVNDAIESDSAVISGSFSNVEANELARLINASIYSYNFKVISVEQSAIISN